MYELFNETDGVFATPDQYKTRKAAEAAAKAFRQRFAIQGYYKTADGLRIDPADVRLVVKVAG